MIINERLYAKVSEKFSLPQSDVKAAVSHFYKSVKDSMRNLEHPAYYIDRIGTVVANKNKIEIQLRKKIKMYKKCRMYLYQNETRNRAIMKNLREDIYKLLLLRREIKRYSKLKKINRNQRTNKIVLDTEMGYYKRPLECDLAPDKGR
jgi:hypothetical protein